jgi:hypothetical protein
MEFPYVAEEELYQLRGGHFRMAYWVVPYLSKSIYYYYNHIELVTKGQEADKIN